MTSFTSFRRGAAAAAAIILLSGTTLEAASPPKNAPIFSDEQDGTNWPSVGRTHNETYFSPLTEINDKTIGRLKLASHIDLPVMISALSTPLAVDGVLYFAVGHSVTYAADAATGKVLWTYDPDVPGATNERLKQAWGIRGLAYDDGSVFVGTEDGRLIALSAKTGKPLWSTQTLMEGDTRYITGAPRVFNGKVIIGHGGADSSKSVRGYVTAYDGKTGKQVWRFFTVPGDPSKGFENKAMEMAAKTWTGEWWKYGGGGTAWNAMTYDPKYNRVYIGTGNGQPWNQKIRSPGGGDNLFLCSIVALDADTGEYVWHYQTTPGETWDYNSDMDMELTTLTIDGKPRDVLLHAPKNGFFYVIDRADGKLISAGKYAKPTWATEIDKATGRPVETPEARLPNGEALLSPGGNGSHNWYAMSYNPITKLVYIPTSYVPGMYNNKGMTAKTWNRQTNPTGYNVSIADELPEADNTPLGVLQAYDPIAQKTVWSVPTLGAYDGGTLSTAGNLVFQGKSSGAFEARAADTGKLLWSFDAQTGVLGTPISYKVKGKQYITVIAGYGGPPAIYGPVSSRFGWQYRTQPRRVLTFAIDGKDTLPPHEKEELEIVDDDAFKIDPARVQKGGAAFTRNCLICHGAGAIAAGGAPDLRASTIPLSSEAFTDVVHNGALRPLGMPQFQELSTDDLENIRHYIRRQARTALKKQQAKSTQ
jgi:quinohemoprotein ethanol dehydrogenase